MLVGADVRYMVNNTPLSGRSIDEVANALGAAASQTAAGPQGPMLIISADAQAPHQAVITVMEAARRKGLAQVTFASQSTSRAAGGR